MRYRWTGVLLLFAALAAVAEDRPRIGLVLGTIWLAFPQVLQILEKVSPAVIGCILAGVLVVAIRPKAIVFVGPVLVAIAFLHFVGWLFKPPPPRQPPQQRGSERAGGGK